MDARKITSLRSCPLQRRLRWPQDGEIDREKQSRRRYDSRSLVADLATPCESRLVAGARGASRAPLNDLNANDTIAGYEAIHMIRKGQACWSAAGCLELKPKFIRLSPSCLRFHNCNTLSWNPPSAA